MEPSPNLATDPKFSLRTNNFSLHTAPWSRSALCLFHHYPTPLPLIPCLVLPHLIGLSPFSLVDPTTNDLLTLFGPIILSSDLFLPTPLPSHSMPLSPNSIPSYPIPFIAAFSSILSLFNPALSSFSLFTLFLVSFSGLQAIHLGLGFIFSLRSLSCIFGEVFRIGASVVGVRFKSLGWLASCGWKELLSLVRTMSSSKQPMGDLEELKEKTNNVSWEDVSKVLKINDDRARDFEALTLIGRLGSRKIFPKPIIYPFIRAGWRFAPNLRIEDVGPNRFLFSF